MTENTATPTVAETVEVLQDAVEKNAKHVNRVKWLRRGLYASAAGLLVVAVVSAVRSDEDETPETESTED